jgi:signal transduction protein with GAF and PtsI domain
MGNLSGWGLTGRLISKHFGALGDKVSEAIASFDPETATQADRDRIQETLMQTAQKLAKARAAFDKEHADVVQLQTLIANDEKAAEKIAERMQSGAISEAAVKMFCDELEANKGRMPEEVQQEADAKEYMSELQQILDALSKQLAEFDAAAKKAMQMLASAKAQKDLQEMRTQRQAELDSLKGVGNHSTALEALSRRAQAVTNEAAGMKIVADLNQKPIDQAAEIDAIRRSVSQGGTTEGESTLDRLKRLSAKA